MVGANAPMMLSPCARERGEHLAADEADLLGAERDEHERVVEPVG
jgi:hypothetical protein